MHRYVQHVPSSLKYPGGSLQEIPLKAAPPEVKRLEDVWYEFLGRTAS